MARGEAAEGPRGDQKGRVVSPFWASRATVETSLGPSTAAKIIAIRAYRGLEEYRNENIIVTGCRPCALARFGPAWAYRDE